MFLSSFLSAAVLVALAQAQTPTGFTPQVNNKLEVFFNSTMVSTPGQQLPKASTASQPQIAISSAMANASDTYIFVMLDLDVPPAEGNTTRRVLLHAMNTGFKATQQTISGAAVLLASPEKGPAAYLAPGPPATDSIAHRYVELLFQQPPTFSVQASDFTGVQARINFDLASFAAENGLGPPIAANFFRVDGRANATTFATASISGTGGMPRSTLPAFEGAVAKREVSHGLAGLLGALVLLAM